MPRKLTIRELFTIPSKRAYRFTHVFLAIQDFKKENQAGADVWFKLNPWAREQGKPKTLALDPKQAYRDALRVEQTGGIALVVRLTKADVASLTWYWSRYGDGSPVGDWKD